MKSALHKKLVDFMLSFANHAEFYSWYTHRKRKRERVREKDTQINQWMFDDTMCAFFSLKGLSVLELSWVDPLKQNILWSFWLIHYHKNFNYRPRFSFFIFCSYSFNLFICPFHFGLNALKQQHDKKIYHWNAWNVSAETLENKKWTWYFSDIFFGHVTNSHSKAVHTVIPKWIGSI